MESATAPMRTASTWLFVFWMIAGSAWGQAVDTTNDVSKGRHLAIMLCTTCHVVAPDQPYAPTLSPPAPSFESIAQRAETDGDSLRKFLITTYQGLDKPKGMPNPVLADFQIKAISAYLLSLRK
jgi:cytochrome c